LDNWEAARNDELDHNKVDPGLSYTKQMYRKILTLEIMGLVGNSTVEERLTVTWGQ
jgi:hypothetical protein